MKTSRWISLALAIIIMAFMVTACAEEEVSGDIIALTNVNVIPMDNTMRITNHGFIPSRSKAAETTVDRTTTPLTERSIPFVRMTKVIPMALIRRNELLRNKFKNTCGLRKPSK